MDGGIFMGKFNIFFKPAVIFLFLSPHNHARASEEVVRSLSLQKAMEISTEVQPTQILPDSGLFSLRLLRRNPSPHARRHRLFFILKQNKHKFFPTADFLKSKNFLPVS
jgi:hypothetical protein